MTQPNQDRCPRCGSDHTLNNADPYKTYPACDHPGHSQASAARDVLTEPMPEGFELGEAAQPPAPDLGGSDAFHDWPPAPELTAEQFRNETHYHSSMGVAAKDMPPV